MPDIVTVQKILDNPRNLVVKFTNFSDGTGESLVKKIDHTLLTPDPTTHMKLWTYAYDIRSMNVRLIWEGTPNADLLVLGGFANAIECGYFGGIPNNAAQATGNLLLSTSGQVAGASYTIILNFKKGV